MDKDFNRYVNLRWSLDDLYGRGCRELRFLEVGTYDGNRASLLLRHWMGLPQKPRAFYYGFDLFEAMTPELNRQELSKARLPPARDTVRARLADAGIAATLYAGNTRVTLPQVAPTLPTMNLVFLDGGHSLETIASDWAALQPVIGPDTVVLLDDYYVNKDDFGCQRLVRRIQEDPAYKVALLDPVDHYPHNGLSIRMVQVTQSIS